MAALVFIASSNEAKSRAEVLSRILSEKGLKPLLWWSAFENGDVTLDKLRLLTDYVDAAVVIWDDDDKTWFRGQNIVTARDNCYLEYGLFLSKLGRYRTGVLAHEKVKLPSDVGGVTVTKYNSMNFETAARTLVGQISNATKPQSPPIVPVAIDKEVYEKHLRPSTIPSNWSGRSLYLGDGGARYLDVSTDPAFSTWFLADRHGTHELHKIAIDSLGDEVTMIDRVISLGPGDGHAEHQLLLHMQSRRATPEWIPVDISQGLLTFAIYRRSELPIPFGIVGDFEDGLTFIFDQIFPEQGDGPRPPRMPTLVTLLGGTFCNLDEEDRIITQLAARLKAGDYLIVDIPVKGKSWTLESDPRSTVSNFPLSFRRFISDGLAARLGIPSNNILDSFEKRIVTQKVPGRIPNTDIIEIVDSASKFKALRFARFDWDASVRWFEQQNFLKLVASHMSEGILGDEILRIGTIMLKIIN
ncbi:MAG: L-histidine N(alpha)-methyltransferase [Candidatus Competibacter sp.]